MEGVSYHHQEVVGVLPVSDESFPVLARKGGQGLYFSVCDLDTVCTPGPGQGGAPGRVAPPLTLARASALVARRPPRTGLAVGDAPDGAVFVVRVLARGRYSAGARGRCVFIVANQAMLSSTGTTGASHHERPH